MTNPICIDEDIEFMAGWQDDMWLVQCFGCAGYANFPAPEAGQAWQEAHKGSCPRDIDDGHDERPPKDLTPE